MFLLYNILGLVFIILSPIFIFFRLLISKEDPNGFLENFPFQKKIKINLVSGFTELVLER